MKIAILDDEFTCHHALHNTILEWKNNKGIDTLSIYHFMSSEDFLSVHNPNKSFDLIFLDIEIQDEINGIELAKQIRKADEYVQIVFISNYIKYAQAGYGLNALRYLHKPVLSEQIIECLNIAFSQWKLRTGTKLIITSKSSTIVIPHHSILYIESQGHELLIHKTDHTKLKTVRCDLKQITLMLSSEMFVQCHRSYIVNLEYVRMFTSSEIFLANGCTIPIGKKYKALFSSSFNHFYQGGFL